MPWTDKQKATAVRACKAAGMSDEHRKLVLRQFSHSLFDKNGKPTNEPSSTSARLNNSDFEQFMAIVERASGDQHLVIRRKDGSVAREFSRNYWRNKAASDGNRMENLVLRIANTLELHELLLPDGVGLAGWISKLTGGKTDKLADLNTTQLTALIEGLKSYGRRHNVRWQDEQQPAPGPRLALAQ